MKFFYGADSLVIKPEFNKGNPSNDYGLGFYLTESRELARLWATKFNHDGYLIEYEVNVKNLKVLHLATIEDQDVLTWISLLISHRFSKEEREENKRRKFRMGKEFWIYSWEYSWECGKRNISGVAQI